MAGDSPAARAAAAWERKYRERIDKIVAMLKVSGKGPWNPEKYTSNSINDFMWLLMEVRYGKQSLEKHDIPVPKRNKFGFGYDIKGD